MNNSECDLRITHKLNELNNKLIHQQRRLVFFYNGIYTSLKNQIEKRLIDDFNVFATIELYSLNEEFNKGLMILNGDPFFAYQFSFNSDVIEFDNLFNEKSSSKVIPNPIRLDQSYCYLMYLILSRGISVTDVLFIDAVWVDVKVDYQFFTEIEEHK